MHNYLTEKCFILGDSSATSLIFVICSLWSESEQFHLRTLTLQCQAESILLSYFSGLYISEFSHFALFNPSFLDAKTFSVAENQTLGCTLYKCL